MRHDRVPVSSASILNLRRPISGFKRNRSRVLSTDCAKRVASASASVSSNPVSRRYQRNCRSKSASNSSERWMIIYAVADEIDLAFFEHPPCDEFGAGCTCLSAPFLQAPEYLHPDLSSC